jgi:superfamily II DNA or RNA helicase
VARQAAGSTGEAARRRRRELARITASLKREIARGEHAGAEVLALLAPAARERLEALRRSGVGTVVLDECHHLASLWGYVARAVVAELGGVHVIGLTATPPDELTTDEADLYEELLGLVDFAVPTPAVVRDGHLAPFQELAWLVEPLHSERRWLEDHEARFRDLVADLHGDAGGGVLDFPEWVITRLRVRGDGDAEVPWTSFQRRHPALARAGVRFLSSGGLELPTRLGDPSAAVWTSPRAPSQKGSTTAP